MRQRHYVAEHADAAAVNLRVTESLRGAVVEEHDPVSQRHRAGGPRDHWRAQRCSDIEQAQGVREHAHVPARDNKDGGIAEQSGDSGAVLGDHRPVMRLPGPVESTANVADAAQMHCIEVANGSHGLGQLIEPELVVPTAALDGIDRLQRIVQAQQVDVLHLLQRPCSCRSAAANSWVTILYLEPSPVQREIHIAGAEQLAQRAVGWLALLPPGGDRGDRPLDGERCRDRVQRRPALRTQQGHPHEA